MHNQPSYTQAANILHLAQSYLAQAQTDAPDYKPASPNEDRCATCRFFDGQRCARYDFAADPDYICDSFQMQEPDIEYRALLEVLIEQYGARNSRIDLADIQAVHDLTVRLGARCDET